MSGPAWCGLSLHDSTRHDSVHRVRCRRGTFYTIREHVVRPLKRRGPVTSLVCADRSDRAEREDLERRVWPELFVVRATYTTHASQMSRRAYCAGEALKEDAARLGRAEAGFSHFVHCRPDLVWSAPISVVSFRMITTKARSASGVGDITADQLTTSSCGPCESIFGTGKGTGPKAGPGRTPCGTRVRKSHL